MPFGRDGVSHRSECLVHVRGAEPATQHEVSLVFGDSSNITRVPFHGGLAQFEHTLDKALD